MMKEKGSCKVTKTDRTEARRCNRESIGGDARLPHVIPLSGASEERGEVRL